MVGREPAGVVERLGSGSTGRSHRLSGGKEVLRPEIAGEACPALRDDGGLHVAVVAHQVPHHFEQVRQRLHAIHEVSRSDPSFADQVERLADVFRGVMETGFAGQFGIVQQVGIELMLVPVGQPPKKFTVPPRRSIRTATCQAPGCPTASMTMSAPRPSVRSFTRGTRSTPSVGHQAFVRTHVRGPIQLALPASDRDHARA